MGNNRLGFGPFYNQVMRSQPLAGVALTVFLFRSLAWISDTYMYVTYVPGARYNDQCHPFSSSHALTARPWAELEEANQTWHEACTNTRALRRMWIHAWERERGKQRRHAPWPPSQNPGTGTVVGNASSSSLFLCARAAFVYISALALMECCGGWAHAVMTSVHKQAGPVRVFPMQVQSATELMHLEK